MKRIAIATVALPLIFGPALGEGIHIGPAGVDVNVGGRGGDRVVREYQDDDGCMVRVTRHRSPDGDMVTSKSRDCD
jgi:hypothetical protein